MMVSFQTVHQSVKQSRLDLLSWIRSFADSFKSSDKSKHNSAKDSSTPEMYIASNTPRMAPLELGQPTRPLSEAASVGNSSTSSLKSPIWDEYERNCLLRL
jgi:hypothetical protein